MRKLILFLTVLMGFSVCTVFAQDRVAASVEVSTLGPGAKLAVNLTDNFNLRFGGNGFTYHYTGKESNIDYKIDLKWMSFPVVVDWFPFKQGLKLTGGIVVNENKVDLTARPAVSYKVGDTVYTADQAGTLSGDIKFKTIAPYAGLGWGNAFGSSLHWSWGVDAGVMFHGKPKLNLTANGTLASNSTFAADLEREKDNVRKKIDKYQYYPVLAVSVTYKF